MMGSCHMHIPTECECWHRTVRDQVRAEVRTASFVTCLWKCLA